MVNTGHDKFINGKLWKTPFTGGIKKIAFDETEKNKTLDWKLFDSLQSKVNGLLKLATLILLQLKWKNS